MLYITNKATAEDIIQSDTHLDAVVSIGPLNDTPPLGFKQLDCLKLLLRFDDHLGKDATPCNRFAADQMLAFGKHIKPDDTLLVYCEMGVSRSPAVAMVILSVTLHPTEAAVMVAQAQRNVQFRPNQWVLRQGELVLGKYGQLQRALNLALKNGASPATVARGRPKGAMPRSK